MDGLWIDGKRKNPNFVPPASQPIGKSLRLSVYSKLDDRTSPNVIAVLPGMDEKLKDQYVVLTAHADHLGVRGDNVYNGALDNAAGVAALLEVARLFQRDRKRPRRSILFIATTAEEAGLVGSEYFVNNPIVPQDSLVANVNLDMPVLLSELTAIVGIGAEHSSLRNVVDGAAGSMGLSHIDDPYLTETFFIRSDHFSFVRGGVPSIFLMLGDKAVYERYKKEHYHNRSDRANLPIRYDQGAKYSELSYRIVKKIANDDQRPTWNKGDFFGRRLTQTQ